MRLQTLFYICFLFIKFAASLPYSASFYGDSFLFEKYSDFSEKTSISLQFQTQSENGLLLIAAGQHDFLIVSLKHGLIEVKLKTSVGEGFIRSPSNVTYNDLLWHDVKISRVRTTVKLSVNDIIVSSQSVVAISDDPAINIDLGVFLGGYDRNVGAKYLTQPTPFFHGCILDAQVNGVDVLEPIFNIPGSKIVHNVDAGCSSIFRVRNQEAISFKSMNSYLKYSRWSNKNQGAFECYIRTNRKNGIILFNTGWERQEFIGLELFEGAIRASVNKGAGVVALQSTEVVNDNNWHKIKFSFTSSILEIRVDHNRTKVFIEQTESDKKIRLRGNLFVGGVDTKIKVKRSKHVSGINFHSFPGCIKDIKVNQKKKTSRDILASHDVGVGCKEMGKFEDKTNIPSLPTFYIVPQPTKRKNKTTEKFIDQVTKYVQRKLCYNLTFNSITLNEGQSQSISTLNLYHLTHDKLVTNDNSALFFTINITKLPVHGTLLHDGNLLHRHDVITIDDVTKGRIVYTNDGSENKFDYFFFEIGNKGISDDLRSKDGKLYNLCYNNHTIINTTFTTFDFKINIIPINDIPTLNIPNNYIFRPIKNARTQLPSTILQSHDSDNNSSEIVYRLFSVANGIYLDSNNNPGRPLSSFTQQEIDNGNIYFVDTGGLRNTRLLFQLSNQDLNSESSVSETYVLRISTKSLEMKLTNHSGITLVEGETKLITANNLFTSHNGMSNQETSNSVTTDVDVQYNLHDGPHLGQIQVLMGDGANSVWSVASVFLQSYLSEDRVRYLSVETPQSDNNIAHDQFTFSMLGAGIETKAYTFNITILKVKIQVNTIPIQIKGGLDTTILSTQQILLNVNGLDQLRDNEIQFVITDNFEHMDLINSNGNIRLSTGDSFTYDELKDKSISITVNEDDIAIKGEIINDETMFHVLVRGKYKSKTTKLLVTYIPDTKIIKIQSTPLVVDEGEKGMITLDSLSAQTLLHKKFLFKILDEPEHGTLKLRGFETNKNLTSFTTNHLAGGNLFYKHDGGESISDSFKFNVTPILVGETPETILDLANSSIVEVFNISIDLINDNSPIRMINQPFNIARNSKRLLTRHDLWYHDPDLDQDDLDLKYVRRGISNGDVINATSKRHERLFEFTQRDIINNRVLFKHKGRNFGRFVFWVRDGKNFATGLFIVNASSPYVEITNSTTLLVLKNMTKNITRSNILSITNVEGLARDIIYRIVEPPAHGNLIFTESNQKVTQFTQHDINENKMAYIHTDSQYFNDFFKYSVTAGHQVAYGNLSILVYLASLQQPPVIKRNRLIVVDQGSTVLVTKSDLRATHVDIRPREITYLVTTPPQYGHIVVNHTDTGVHRSVSVSSFTQWDINQGSLWYISLNNTLFDVFTPRDKLVCDVTNGVLAMKNVTINFEIIPEIIPLRVSNFTVGEGRTKVLIQEFLHIGSEHFDDLQIQIDVVTQPEHGRLESTRNSGTKLENFSLRLALAEFVYYIHDGSDTIQDFFQLQARMLDGSKLSPVKTIFVNIEPDNDQTPKVVNNTGAMIWVNSTTVLTSLELGSFDLDSPPQDIHYEVIPPGNGHLCYSTNPSVTVTSFTQEDINVENISFVHSGSYTGGFTFQVNDGLNYDVKQIFVITARPLVITVLPTHFLQVFPNTTQQISATNIYSKTDDKDEKRKIFYKIIKNPSYGKIVKKTLSEEISYYKEVENFTQSEIEFGKIFYKQNREISMWQVKDKLELKVSSPPAQDVSKVYLNISISYDDYHLVEGKTSSLQTNTGGVVIEGETLNIMIKEINANNLLKKVDLEKRKKYQIRILITKLPLHGELFLGEKKLNTNEKFNIKTDNLLYVHDNSENFNDSFTFEAQLTNTKTQTSIFTIEDKLKIKILPLNDNPPIILTKSPFLQMVHGTIACINQTMLNSEDIDNTANQTVYKVIRPPNYGKLLINQKIVNSFTQHDVNQNLVFFQQNVGGNTGLNKVDTREVDDAFYFSLTDGKHKPSYSLFRIKILPISVNLHISPLYITQGSFSVPLTTKLIHASTNANPDLLVFNVTTLPEAGSLYIGEYEVTFFTYHNLIHNDITYVMNDVTHDNDHIMIMMKYNDSRLSQQPNTTAQLNIVVKPLIKTVPFQVFPNMQNQLTLSVLDATELAEQTGSVPIYDVIGLPQYAEVIVTKDFNNTSRRRRSSNDIISFTHYDVINGNVYLDVPNVNITNTTEINDQLIYKLKVKDCSVQPAVGNLKFKIISYNNDDIIQTTTKYDITSADILPTTEIISTTQLNLPVDDITTNKKTTTITETTIKTTATTTVLDSKVIMREVNSSKSSVTWIIPLIVGLSIILLVVIGLVCFVKHQHNKRGPAYVRGHETTLKAASNRVVVESLMPQAPEDEPRSVTYVPQVPQVMAIDSNTTVKVTSRPDLLETPEQCPTTSVTVTPLNNNFDDVYDDDDVDDYYDDGYLSNSVPLESILRGTMVQAVPIYEDNYNERSYSMNLVDDEVQSSQESVNDVVHYNDVTGHDDVMVQGRNRASLGSIPGARNLSAPPDGKVDQYWV